MNRDWQKVIRSGDVNAARLLLEAGANANARDKHGQTALMNAAALGHVDIVRLLVEAGAELNATAKYNLSAWMLAIINGHQDISRLLIEAGADVDIRGGKGAIDSMISKPFYWQRSEGRMKLPNC